MRSRLLASATILPVFITYDCELIISSEHLLPALFAAHPLMHRLALFGCGLVQLLGSLLIVAKAAFQAQGRGAADPGLYLDRVLRPARRTRKVHSSCRHSLTL